MKLLKFILTGVMTVIVMTGVSLQAKAMETFDYEVLSDDTISLTCTDKNIKNVEIPTEIDGHTVTMLADNCFDGCTVLESVTIPDTIDRLGLYVFQGCSSLKSVNIPQSVKEIKDFCFEGCVGLVEITVDEENTAYCSRDGVLFNKSCETLIRYPQEKESEEYQIPDECRTVSPWSFTDTHHLRILSMSAVERIGADAFMGSTHLREVQLSDKIEELIGASFAKCPLLMNVKFPSKLRIIGDRCFFDCARLHNVEFPDGLQSIGEMAFYGCTKLGEVKIPSSVKTIGENGIGFTVDEAGQPFVIPDVVLDVDFGSKAYDYARENGIAFHSAVSGNAVMLVVVIAVMLILLIVGIVITIRQNQFAKEAEKEQKEEQERLQRVAELQERRKQRKNQ
ncbi:MAG TPA: hypothetical protein DCO72_05150 [Ruminococcus sp.]|nr:hypothetical protein [Ruminococcus sp.]